MKHQSSEKTVNCIWCHGPIGGIKYSALTDRLGYVEGKWNLIECRDCNSLVLSPFPNPGEVLDYYPKNYNIPSPSRTRGIKKMLSALESKFLSFCNSSDAKKIYRSLPIFENTGVKILEVGCGSGSHAEFFHRIKCDVVGVDMSQEDINAVKAKGIKAVCCDVQSLDQHFEAESFDVIMSFDVLEHVPNLEEFVKKTLGFLRPGGWLVAGLPSQDSFAVRLLGSRWAAFREVPRHVSVPSIKGAENFLQRLGIKKIRKFPYGSLNCSLVLGLSLMRSGASHSFYGEQGSLVNLLSRVGGAVILLLSVPLFFFENRFTSHFSRFVIYGQK